jgi:hypothetical protein
MLSDILTGYIFRPKENGPYFDRRAKYKLKELSLGNK